MIKKSVILKTHCWSHNLENFAVKIYRECTEANIDFFIVMHTETGNFYGKIESDFIKKITHSVTEEEIKGLYQEGFFSMWLSNHWLLMWFYLKFGKSYDYIWSMEYDVRISGDSSLIWNHQSNDDFLFVDGNYRNNLNMYNTCYIGNKLSENEKYHGYLQLSRYSRRALEYLNKCFEEGENGQDELIIFSLINRGKFSLSKTFLKSLIKGSWTWRPQFAPYNQLQYDFYEKMDKNNLHIFHPIK